MAEVVQPHDDDKEETSGDEILAKVGLAEKLFQAGDLRAAFELVREATKWQNIKSSDETLAKDDKFWPGVFRSLRLFGQMEMKVGAATTAIDLFCRALIVYRHHENVVTELSEVALLFDDLVECAARVPGNAEHGLVWADAALAFKAVKGARLVRLWTVKGRLHIQEKHTRQAVICMNVALQWAVDEKLPLSDIACCTKNIGEIFCLMGGRDEEARKLLQEAQRIWESDGVENGEYAMCIYHQAVIELRQKKLGTEKALLEKAATIMQRLHDPRVNLINSSVEAIREYLNVAGGNAKMQDQSNAAHARK